MSKYIKQDDIFELVRTGRLVSNSNFKSVCKAVGSLPTIEVSDKADRPFEYFEGFEDGKASVEVSEDCISREYMLETAQAWKNMYPDSDTAREALTMMINEIDTAPSVVPTTEQSPMVGKWMPIVEATEMGEPYIAGIYCSECGETLRCEANFCPNCGAKMKG